MWVPVPVGGSVVVLVGVRWQCLVLQLVDMPVGTPVGVLGIRRRWVGEGGVGELQVNGHGEPDTERCQPQQQSRRDRDAPPGANSPRHHRPILAGGCGCVKPVVGWRLDPPNGALTP